MFRRYSWRSLVALAVAAIALALGAGPVLAHGGGIGVGGRQEVTVPLWLVLTTGGAAVGASFLLATFVTDRSLVRAVDGWRRRLPAAPRALALLARAVGVAGLAGVLAVGVAGPQQPIANAGLLVVWIGWWAGYTMTAYLVGNSWPLFNPWRTIATALPTLDRSYPDRLGAWPATAALLALVWLEVASPVADDPTLLAGVIVGYSVLTVAGAVVFGPSSWFRRADPIARVFDHYGHVAPVQRDADGISLTLPGNTLPDLDLAGRSEVAFVVALLWVTTFDGFVATPAWRTIVDAAGGIGVPLTVLYPAALAVGFGLFLSVFYGAAELSRRSGRTYVTPGELARRFAPSLLAIAAGYHFAHYLGYFLSNLGPLLVAISTPLSTLAGVPATLPPWFDLIGMAAILVGHVFAIWVAHATAYEIFPGRLQAIRSQYPFIAVMVFYTMTSLWIVGQPEVAAP
jgi:hypothetical protein